MNYNFIRQFLISAIIIGIITLLGCTSNEKVNESCLKFESEIYSPEVLDDSLLLEIESYKEYLLKMFEETDVENLEQEVYHLQYYSSHGFGKSIKFASTANDWLLKVKCVGKWYDECKDYTIKIEEEEWKVFDEIIYEFNFWTSDTYRANLNVLDGYAFLIEGNRPEAKNCDKKSYKIIVRGSPRYDKMESLCNNIFAYEEHLRFRYEQKNLIE